MLPMKKEFKFLTAALLRIQVGKMWRGVFGYGSSDLSIEGDVFIIRGQPVHYFLDQVYPEIKDTN